MADERTHHITIQLTRDYQFAARFDDVPGAPTISFDEPEPLGHNTAPNAAAVLGAAVGNCLAASLSYCLRRARIDLHGLTANVTTHVVRNERGRHRIGSIDVAVTPELGEGTNIERCQELFEDFCTVTASVQRGIPVHVSLKREAVEHAA